MIRKATRFDKVELIDMLHQFNKEYLPSYTQYFNDDCVDKLLTNVVAGAGIALIEEGKGLILGVISPCTYDNSILILSELAWYVKPKYRNTSLGFRLFKEYLNESDSLKENNRIKASIFCKLHNGVDVKYQKYGFEKLQESWVK